MARLWTRETGIEERYLDHGFEETRTYLTSRTEAESTRGRCPSGHQIEREDSRPRGPDRQRLDRQDWARIRFLSETRRLVFHWRQRSGLTEMPGDKGGYFQAKLILRAIDRRPLIHYRTVRQC